MAKMLQNITTSVNQRLRLTINGTVQGVGFRPFVYRLARSLRLRGWVENTPQGVTIEVEGAEEVLSEFQARLLSEKPLLASIDKCESSILAAKELVGFEIRKSHDGGTRSALILPDIATCADCLRDVLDTNNRRYRYPFTNCTNCGPRFSIIKSLPYDRPNTSMKQFSMCSACIAEYEDPADRRFHAQPNACPDCGPHLELWNSEGQAIAKHDAALLRAIGELRQGRILALKGLGGFQLLVDAGNCDAVQQLRKRKHRWEKPFAVMVASLKHVRKICTIDSEAACLLQSPAAPIVLLDRIEGPGNQVSPAVAPGHPCLGVMLPYTPLHHLLLRAVDFPLVATSGNLADEPICIDEHEALGRLRGIADVFLVHNRPIVRHVDDSVTRVIHSRPMMLRRARGYSPIPIEDPHAVDPILGVGAQQKNTVAFAAHGKIFVSQHIGDLVTKQSMEAFEAATADLPRLYDAQPKAIACDRHPDYQSTRYAHRGAEKMVAIQHHHAHIVSCMVDNDLDGTVLGVSWDGTGLGPDGTIWGGEFLRCDRATYERFAHLRPFPLPGGDLASREPRRSAIGLLYELFGPGLFDPGLFDQDVLDSSDVATLTSFDKSERSVIRQILLQTLNCPVTSSMGRLFDAIASITGIRQRVFNEGQAAMEIEFRAALDTTPDTYPFSIRPNAPSDHRVLIVDWKPMVLDILDELSRKVPVSRIARKLHNTLVEFTVDIAHRANENRVVLSGGCFQNRLLTELLISRLASEGFQPYWHKHIPPNDGGIALGQAAVAQRRLTEFSSCV